MRTRDDGIDRALRHRAVAAFAANREMKLIGGGEERAVAHADFSGVQPAEHVQRKTAIDVRVFQRTVLDHQFVSGVPLLAGLKTKHERSGDLIAPPREPLLQHRAESRCARRARTRALLRRSSDLYGTSAVSVTGSASMSARSSVTGPGLPPSSVASTPVSADARANVVQAQRPQFAL